MATTDKYLELWNVTKAFEGPTGVIEVVKDFQLDVRPGEFVSLIGHSGCGKSTVLSMIAGLTEPTSGGIMLGGREIDGPGPDRGVVFQAPCLLPWLTAAQNVLLGVEQVYPRESRQRHNEIVDEYLELVGLLDARHKRPAELSGGMRQRVGIARAFALSPKLLLLDEPFGMLDSLTRLELQDVLLSVWLKHRMTAVMVTHDVDEAILLSDRVVMMTNGPHAHVGEIVKVPFERPRNRIELLDSTAYEDVRDNVLGFLEERSHLKSRLAQTGVSDTPVRQTTSERTQGS